MIIQKRACNHKKYDEQYFCFEESCLQKQDYKLGCLKCLQDSHQHHECIQHIEAILQDAQRNQRIFLEEFEENLTYCQNIKRQLEKDTEQIKQVFSGWIEKQQKRSLQQIEQYEFTLNEHKQKFSSVQLSSDNLKTLVDFSLYNYTSFQQQNQEIKQILEQNQLEFTKYFNVLFERFFVNHDPHNRLNGFQIQITKNNVKSMKFEQCTEIGCNNQKNKFCLEQTCLQKFCTFECPSCQTSRHHIENKQSHRQFIFSANELWDQQNNKIDELEIFCDNQGKQIKKESLELQGTITECLIENERKLKQFRQLVQSKENDILIKLRKFKQYYQKDQLVIFKELFLEKDLSFIAADFQQFLETLRGISINFKKQYLKEEQTSAEKEIQILEDEWFQIFQPENQLFDKSETNTVGKKIQSMREQIISLTEQNQEHQIKIEQLTQDQATQKKDQYFEKLFVTAINKELENQVINQSSQLKQQTIELLKETNFKKMIEEMMPSIKNEIRFFHQCILEKINYIERLTHDHTNKIDDIVTISKTSRIQNNLHTIPNQDIVQQNNAQIICQIQENFKEQQKQLFKKIDQLYIEQQKQLFEKIDKLQNSIQKHQEIIKQNPLQVIDRNVINFIEEQKKLLEHQSIQLVKIEGIEQKLNQMNERLNQQNRGWLPWR